MAADLTFSHSADRPLHPRTIINRNLFGWRNMGFSFGARGFLGTLYANGDAEVRRSDGFLAHDEDPIAKRAIAFWRQHCLTNRERLVDLWMRYLTGQHVWEDRRL